MSPVQEKKPGGVSGLVSWTLSMVPDWFLGFWGWRHFFGVDSVSVVSVL